jgi:diadenosine tetraphosphate (Ap4A) HIT family hydrolase
MMTTRIHSFILLMSCWSSLKRRSVVALVLVVLSFISMLLDPVSAFSNNNNNKIQSVMPQPLLPQTTTTTTTTTTHTPPPGVDYADNPTVFGKILRGELPANVVLDESPTLLAFEDIRPRAPLHALIIPKQFLESVYDLDDLVLLQEMRDMALQIILQKHQHQHQPHHHAAFLNSNNKEDYLLCFHIPPFNSVNHLHLHVLAPISELSAYGRLKYRAGARWCISEEEVRKRLEAGKTPVPYKRWERSSTLQVAAYTTIVMGGLAILILH